MANVLETLQPGGRVAVVRLRSLGDCILTTPALELLKAHRPDLRIAVVVEDRFAPVFEGNPDVDVILSPELRGIRKWRPHLTLNLHGGNTSARLTALSGARIRAGFEHFAHPLIYTTPIPKAQQIYGLRRKVHTVEHLASAVFYLGVPPGPIPGTRLFASPPEPGPSYAVIHPLASERSKTWPAANFLEIAARLGVEPIFIAGRGEDLSLFSAWRTIVGEPLSSLKSLIRGASLFLGNDSGPAHMAAAFGVPAVVLFGGSDPEIWRPWAAPSTVVRGPRGMDSIRVADVQSAIETVLLKEATA